MARKQEKVPHEPLLEWIAAGIGLVLILAVVAVIGREALSGEAAQPPMIEVKAARIVPTATGYIVEVAAINRSGGNAAIVEVEGELLSGGTPVETSSFTFDYIPGHAMRKGGLFFRNDPRNHRLALRALGYQTP